jgi:hypothetical protein
MNNIVYYLSFYIEISGFLFPEELPKNYYAPGLFLIEMDNDRRFSYGYTFDAMDNGRRISLIMIRADEGDQDSKLYVVKTLHYGSFWFNLEKINPNLVYKGSKEQLLNHNEFRVAKSTDSGKLERVCHNFDFYFIGSTLREDDL